ncbi:hypothetical protein P7K49_004696, partial [Saguinus oedipus]
MPDSAQLAATPNPSDRRPERCHHRENGGIQQQTVPRPKNSTRRNSSRVLYIAGSLRVTPAGGVAQDNIRFGATNGAVAEKMSTLGKERFWDREIRCNKCCDRKLHRSALLEKKPTKRRVLRPESANEKLPAEFTYGCFAWDPQIRQTRGLGPSTLRKWEMAYQHKYCFWLDGAVHEHPLALRNELQ